MSPSRSDEVVLTEMWRNLRDLIRQEVKSGIPTSTKTEDPLTFGEPHTGGGEVWNFIFKGGYYDIAVGTSYEIQYHENYEVKSVTLFSKQTGSIVIDIWKSAVLPGGYPPTAANKITAAAPPTLSSASYATDSTLTAWTTLLEANRILALNVTSCTGIRSCTLSLKVRKIT